MNRIIPLILAVALFMEQMDSTVIATSLPAIAADLHVGPITLKLALTAYMVALAIFIPISGWMADKYGAKKIFRFAIGVFVVGSICCAVSSSVFEFVLSRFLQGMGGAMMTPVGRLVLLRTTKRSELVSAMALLTIPGLVGPLTGPPIGGFITTYFSWHWIFLINVPIGIIGIWLSTIFLPEIETTNPPPMDGKGFVLSGIAASGVVFGLSVVSLPALPPAIGIASTIIGFICGFLYLRHAARHPAPILDFRIFQNATFRAASVGGTVFRISTGAIPFLMPLMLQIGFGLNPFQSGMITFAGAIGAITTKFMAKRVFAATGFRSTLIGAGIVGACTTLANSFFTPETPYPLIMIFLVTAGFARSFFFTGSNALSYSDIEDRQASQATSMASVLQQISLAVGVAFAASILEVSSTMSGTHLQLADFHIAFTIVALVSLFAIVPIIRMDGNAGAAVSGHRGKVSQPAE
ncbi:MDR family MFS transporter [Agrobacterium salinitolerans]|uniref:MFS transporter n=1 Tax=Agrobacterium salinitolerans TaxID=1183413 RepID=A0A9X3QZ71_9HYPH|nr:MULTISPECIES: MDR family MFS transporter [Agrobacterium]MCZ7850550.1 MDR family MFS transporter [Agrobacterium salinitolerans]MCZ7891143.1 MDR family MFS transporter [Agrobacterium salinitolerans]MCZ7937748.1 MDR family MFS transporter [Agrobacterium salinitolerans]MCZ7973706.1 MDR family MFS transporter [Agrobacterium salinitolerans]TRA93342.1 MFS transporter [Agrobacterium salinitolerans]